ncbi:MAG: single-stranded-DNA-specific exonuclease RecJ [Candidatus Moranbacteria bacterium]|jgi:single-stranded-DNA-specific exonuclease|nr:single-stranded-DNA-specific exonuclease RecJ [Candidatus Moranbacteria bacterium]MDD5651949.1 single-stranded-DNA-specific exonuclease RecJ [Candidatus Moranbacteria bacterium]MDX9855506.1 single-stranded-DNA-specific exonuclease RecJ [Candidatus Moranbacteria bacterium]
MNWKIKENKKDLKTDDKNSRPFSLHPVVLKILAQRGITGSDEIKSFIFPDYDKGVHSPFLFEKMEKAMERLKKIDRKKEKILVFGDYDADGITSALIAKKSLEEAGFETFVYIPHKEKEGYGLNRKAMEKFLEKGVRLVVTTDCGIANKKEIEDMTGRGVDFIVTDHHHIPPEIPDAIAIINPKMKDSGYPFEDLSGAGVSFKFAQAVYETFIPEKKEQIKWLLDLVAIGTVADLVSLRGENRILVKFGLLVLSKTKRVGLQEMFKVGRILVDENNFPDSQKISFQIAPRINAASRMSHAEKALFLLAEDDRVKARDMALELEAQNSSRQKETQQVVAEAEKIVSNIFKDRNFIFIANENFPIGTVGLVAGKLADKFRRPAAILKKGKKTSKGSFRSISQINIIENIEKCRDLLLKYGGHSQAAGITIKNENLEKFYDKMDEIISEEIKELDLSPEVEVDMEIFPGDISFGLAEDLKKLEPFGQGNREPVFLMKNLSIKELKWLGNGEKHLKLFLQPKNKSPKIFEAIGFSMLEKFGDIKIGETIDLVFNLGQDEWNGNKKIQMKIIDLKTSKTD